jgi:hypothetical protein
MATWCGFWWIFGRVEFPGILYTVFDFTLPSGDRKGNWGKNMEKIQDKWNNDYFLSFTCVGVTNLMLWGEYKKE